MAVNRCQQSPSSHGALVQWVRQLGSHMLKCILAHYDKCHQERLWSVGYETRAWSTQEVACAWSSERWLWTGERHVGRGRKGKVEETTFPRIWVARVPGMEGTKSEGGIWWKGNHGWFFSIKVVVKSENQQDSSGYRVEYGLEKMRVAQANCISPL